MKRIQTALIAAALSGCCILGIAQDGFRGVQRGFGGRQNARQNNARQGGFGGMQGGFGGMQGGFGGERQNRPPSADAAARPETGSKRPFGAGPYDTSAFMAGEIYVNLVLFESNGKTDPDTENWSRDEIDKVIAHVKNACAWWEEMWKRKNYIGELHFTIGLDHATTPFQTSYEPITHGAFRDDRLWIGEFLNAQGYSGGKNQMLYQYTADTIMGSS